jgi:hypothetical protein
MQRNPNSMIDPYRLADELEYELGYRVALTALREGGVCFYLEVLNQDGTDLPLADRNRVDAVIAYHDQEPPSWVEEARD